VLSGYTLSVRMGSADSAINKGKCIERNSTSKTTNKTKEEHKEEEH
jgi:hypothetical protein